MERREGDLEAKKAGRRRFAPYLAGIAAAVCIPYAVTLCVSGAGGTDGLWGIVGGKTQSGGSGGRRIVFDDGQRGYMDAEDYLVGVVAGQIPAEYEKEALKAQAILARTYLYRQMGDADTIGAGQAGVRCLEPEMLEEMWGEGRFSEYYEKIKSAVSETAGMVLTYDGELAEPLFHRVSAGSTRDGGERYPYLTAVESERDVEAEGYLTVTEWEPEEFWQMFGAAEGERQIQLVSRDAGGYVEEIEIGAHTYTGDEVRELLGLKSPAFVLQDREGNIQAVTRGIGHGFGMSQYGASRLAADGWDAEKILKYYYQNAEIILSDP